MRTRPLIQACRMSMIVSLLLTLTPAMAVAVERGLTVYSALPWEELKKIEHSFKEENPDIEVRFIRDSAGIITAKLLAERDFQRADIVLGVPASSLLLLKQEGMLEPYSPRNLESLDPRFVDQDSEPSWIGMGVWASGICVNHLALEKYGLPVPTTWEQLTDPQYNGLISMPNPNASGTGYLAISSWLQIFGENRGAWRFMDALHENIATYTRGGGEPCMLAASGKVPIGISYTLRGAQLISEGAPIDVVIPGEGIGWEVDAAAILRGTDQLLDAMRFLDWVASRPANEIYRQFYDFVAYGGMAGVNISQPTMVEDALIDHAFGDAAWNREKILSEWQARYDAKSGAKF